MSSHSTATSSRRPPGSFSPIPTLAAASATASASSSQLNSSSSSLRALSARPDVGTDSDASESHLYPRPHPVAQSRPLPQRQHSSQHLPPTLPPLNTNPQNFSRPTAARTSDASIRAASPLSIHSTGSNLGADSPRGHARKHSNSAGFFEPTVKSALPSNLSIASGAAASAMAGGAAPDISRIAAQAAMQQPQAQHLRQRSQTIPAPPESSSSSIIGQRRPSRGPVSPPILSLTEASQPQGGFGGQSYQNGLLGSRTNAAATAASVVFARSPQTSPGLPAQEFVVPERPLKSEKSKVKLFSRPGKIGTSKDKDVKEKAQPSPNKLGSFAMNNFQRGNMSMQSLVESPSTATSLYSLNNSSAATIRAVDSYTSLEKDTGQSKDPSKEKEKQHRHHFLSRQKHKLGSKDEHHLNLSSASSNSMPTDPKAPSSLYNFNLPSSPGPGSTSFSKSMSGLDLRHGGRALREKKREERAAAAAAAGDREREDAASEWPAPSNLGAPFLGPPSAGYATSTYGSEVTDMGKYGLNHMQVEDAWPYLRAKLLIVFEGDELRLPVEDFNRLVTMHLRICIQKRSPQMMVEDFKDFLATGFGSLDQTLRYTPDDRLVPHLIQMWILVYTKILPYIQAVFLPLDLEFAGQGSLMSAEAAREFWGPLTSSHEYTSPLNHNLEVRRIVLVAYRDKVITPRYDTLKTIFSRLSLESINNSFSAQPVLSSSPDYFNFGRPGTAASLDPSLGSYNSQSTTLLGGSSNSTDTPLGARSRAISNVSFGSSDSNPGGRPPSRPFTPGATASINIPAGAGSGSGQSSSHAAAVWSLQHNDQSAREANAEDSKYVTEMVGRMLQCMSVLASLGGSGGEEEDERQRMMDELCRALKLNWLGRGRTGRNRRGFVPPKMTPSAGQRAGLVS